MKPTISITIPTLNEESYVPRLLRSLAHQRVAMQVFVIDAHSEDGTKRVVEACQALFTGESSLTFVASPEKGISFQRNYGARLATSDTLLFLDADVLVPENALQRMLSEFVKRKLDIASTLLCPDEKDVRGSAIFLLGRIFQRIMLLRNRAYFAGSCTLCRAAAFRSSGGYDEAQKVGEDVDLSLRMSARGRAGLLSVRMPVSMRRFKKYGYWKVFVQWFLGIAASVLGVENKIAVHKYPFGEYGKV